MRARAWGALLLAACAAAPEGADELPATDALLGAGYAGAAAQALALEEGQGGRWWERFGDPHTDRLVDAALAGNLDLRAAAARVLEAQARARSSHGSRLPTLDAFLGGARAFDTLPSGERAYANDLRAGAVLSWQADLFGRLRAGERARAAEWMASANDREALAHSLVAAVVRSRVALSIGLQRLALAREVVASRGSTLAIVEGRYARGVVSTSAVDVRLARENQSAAEAAVPERELELARSGHALDELLGQKPGTSAADTGLALGLPETAPPPPGLPVRLLDRRPDLRAAAFRASAAAAEVDVALAALWPDLVLTAAGGFGAGELEDLLSSGNLFGSLAADLAVRLFAGGRLRAEVEGAEARFAAQAADYAATVLAAVREVEDALVAERRLREQLAFVQRQRDEAGQAEELARERYRRGLENLLTVLETERRRSNADDLALRLTAAVWNARVDLHLALGGDWSLEGEQAVAEAGTIR